MYNKIHTSWSIFFKQEKQKTYYQQLLAFLKKERQNKTIYPKEANIFNAFQYTTLHDLKVVILGQDPYHGQDQANGLAFSVSKGIAIPPSLKNIYKELNNSIEKFQIPTHGDLTNIAQQGVLLLNTILTVEKDLPRSHRNQGWETFTQHVLQYIQQHTKNTIFILWGNDAKKYQSHIDQNTHQLILGVHPSPLSAYRGFFGCNHFNLINDYLIKSNKNPIDWTITI